MRILLSRAGVFRRIACAAAPVLPLCLFACSLPPDAQELRGRLAATVQMGWSGLRIEAVEILERVEAGRDWKVVLSYRARLTQDAGALPQEEQERILRHLSLCVPVLQRAGDHCALRESVIFTRSAYGWMPKELVAGRPDLLPHIAEEGRRIVAGAIPD
jgi:hypothetical protein